MLSACMQHHWQFCRQTRKSMVSNMSSESQQPTMSSVSSMSREGSIHSNNTTGAESSDRWSLSESSTGYELEDPPPLEDNLAKYIVAIMSRFMYQMAAAEDREYGPGSTGNITGRAEYTIGGGGNGTSTDIMTDIYKAASRIVFYVSASNWPIMFAKIKARLIHLSTTVEENPETADVRLLECSALNSERLAMVLGGIVF